MRTNEQFRQEVLARSKKKIRMRRQKRCALCCASVLLCCLLTWIFWPQPPSGSVPPVAALVEVRGYPNLQRQYSDREKIAELTAACRKAAHSRPEGESQQKGFSELQAVPPYTVKITDAEGNTEIYTITSGDTAPLLLLERLASDREETT